MSELPPEKTIGRLRYLNTPTSNWAADRIEAEDEAAAWYAKQGLLTGAYAVVIEEPLDGHTEDNIP